MIANHKLECRKKGAMWYIEGIKCLKSEVHGGPTRKKGTKSGLDDGHMYWSICPVRRPVKIRMLCQMAAELLSWPALANVFFFSSQFLPDLWIDTCSMFRSFLLLSTMHSKSYLAWPTFFHQSHLFLRSCTFSVH